MSLKQIRGVLPPILTPFTQSGELDERAHRFNLEKWNGVGLAGYLVLGSNGEAPYLSEAEKIRLITLTAEHAAGGRMIMAGTGLESTRETIRLTNLAAGAGAHAALVITPAFFGSQMNNDALVGHYRAVADASRIPVLIYNVPAYTRLSVPADVIGELSTHENIAGMKDSSGDIDRIGTIRAVVPDSFQYIIGSAAAWYPGLLRGVGAGILALSNFAGSACAQLQRLVDEGKKDEAAKLHEKIVPVNTAVTSKYGVAGLKYASSLFGYQAGYVRSPLRELSKDAREDMKGIISQSGLSE
jgi:4-hydroxy-2-oxoglutarate aldolase